MLIDGVEKLNICIEVKYYLLNDHINKMNIINMDRSFQIIMDHAKHLTWYEFFNFYKNASFVNKSIIVYGQNLPRYDKKLNLDIDISRIEKGTIADLLFEKQKNIQQPWEFQCHVYDNVKDFFIVRDSHAIRHISWIYYYNQRNRILALSEQEAEIKFCLTLPKFRGLGIYPKVLCAIMDYLELAGISRVFICAERGNHPSIRGIEKAGFKRVGEVRLMKLFGIQVSSRLDTKRIQ